MKLLLFCFSLLFSLFSYGQKKTEISGIVTDNSTGKPIHGVHIIIPTLSLGTVTKEDGSFFINSKDIKSSDSILFSHIGYVNFTKSVFQLLESTDTEKIWLNEDTLFLQDVLIMEKYKEWSPKDIALETIRLFNTDKRKKSHIASAHFIEKAKVNGKYVMYTEALGYSVYMGKDNDWSELALYQFYANNIKKSNRSSEWVYFINNSSKSNENHKDVIYGGSVSLQGFQHISITGVLSLEKVEKYKYELKSYMSNSREIYQISFDKIGDSGFLEVYADNLHLKSISCKAIKLWSTPLNKRVMADMTYYFKYYNNTPFVYEAKTFYAKGKLEHWNEIRIITQKFNDFKLSHHEIGLFNTENPYVSYDYHTWRKYRGYEDKDISFIRKDLEVGKNNKMEKQFIENSGKLYLGGNEDGRSKEVRKLIKNLTLGF